MNTENDWEHTAEANMVDGLIEKVTQKEMMTAMKPGKAAGSFEGCAEMISVSGKVGVNMIMELCQYVANGKGMSDEWQTSVLVPIFKEKFDVRNCNLCRGVKLLEHAMKIVERVLARSIQKSLYANAMQFRPTAGRETTDAFFVMKTVQKEYKDEKNCGIWVF